MKVEREMRRVHRDGVRDQSTNALIDMSANRLSASPEEAMVDDQQIGSLLDGAFDRAGRSIDGDGAAGDRANVFDLTSRAMVRKACGKSITTLAMVMSGATAFWLELDPMTRAFFVSRAA